MKSIFFRKHYHKEEGRPTRRSSFLSTVDSFFFVYFPYSIFIFYLLFSLSLLPQYSYTVYSIYVRRIGVSHNHKNNTFSFFPFILSIQYILKRKNYKEAKCIMNKYNIKIYVNIVGVCCI